MPRSSFETLYRNSLRGLLGRSGLFWQRSSAGAAFESCRGGAMLLVEAGHGLGWQPSKAAAEGFKVLRF